MILHRATCDDCWAVHRLQSSAYDTKFQESPDVLREILARNLSFVAKDEHDIVLGYILAHAFDDVHTPPELNSRVPVSGPFLFIHDLCVLPSRQRQGAGSSLAMAIHDMYRRSNFKGLYLVALEETIPFWYRQGFVPADVPTSWAYQSHYGPRSMYMQLDEM